MREHKFRGKRLDNGEWEIGWYVQTNTGEHRIANIGPEKLPELYAVDPATVGQFTGLIDKTGAEIFEGDIVLALCAQTGYTKKQIKQQRAIVAWDGHGVKVLLIDIEPGKKHAAGYCAWGLNGNGFEVIGNIYGTEVPHE